MSGGETGSEISQAEQESRKMEAKGYLETLYILNGSKNTDSIISKMKEAVVNDNEPAVRDILLKNAPQVEKIFGLFDFLKHYKKTDARLRHDLGNIAVAVEGFLEVFLFDVQEGKKVDLKNLISVLERWGRYLVGVEDILLRIVSEDVVLPEYNTGVSLDTLSGAINFFSDKELPKMREFVRKDSNEQTTDSAYKEINKKKFDSVSLVDWKRINDELGDREIVGNTGLVGNFLLNALRNSLKDRVEADNVRLSAKIDGDYFVLRVEDDGKGIKKGFLQEKFEGVDKETSERVEVINPHYIFREGASGTGSTGIGLANFDTRLASVGGELYVVTKPKYVDEGVNRFQYGSTDEKAKTVQFDENLKHGTVFEIRLPITQKQK